MMSGVLMSGVLMSGVLMSGMMSGVLIKVNFVATSCQIKTTSCQRYECSATIGPCSSNGVCGFMDVWVWKMDKPEGFGTNFLLRQRAFFPKALRRVLPENPLNTDTSTLTLRHT